METYRGLILAQRSAGDRGKFIDMLTARSTVQEVYVRGAKKTASSGVSATQMFTYGRFSVQQCGTTYYLDSAESIRIFYRLRESLTRLSLASYFSELVQMSVREFRTPGEPCDVMRLMLNTLHFLETGTRPEEMLKPLFELRLMTELGMMPDVLMCRRCGKFLPDQLYFSVEEGYFCCKDCGVPSAQHTPVLLHVPALQAMRHIIFADFNRLYRFRLGPENLAALRQYTERFVQYHLGFPLKSLAFYHEMTGQKDA